jgi:hypothetical protein
MKFVVVILAAMFASCGYRVAGKSDLLPPTIHTVAVPAFGNGTARYKITDVMSEAFAREFVAHTRYKVVSDPGQADMVLHGNILRYSYNPTIFDPKTQRANVAELHVQLQVSLVERATGKVLFQRPGFDVKETYQISADPVQYFGEDDIAVRRASERVAQQVVTAILENF